MPGAYSVLSQVDFSGGMWRAGDPELMPANSFFDGENTLLDRLGMPYARGGASFGDSESLDTAGMTFVWDGILASGHSTIVASPNHFAKLSGGKYTTFGAGLKVPGRAASMLGTLYFPGGVTYDGTTAGTAKAVTPFYTVAANRLIAAGGSRVAFSVVKDPTKFETGDFHEIPGGAEILGVEGSRDACVVFTTRGVWIISNMAVALTDGTGNVQHRLDHYSGDLVLWGDAGVAAWEGALVVPGTDAVWLVRRGVTSETPNAFQRISDPIVALYQEYVRAGYRPGQATVYRNHYLLPIFSSGRIVDLLVARLDLTGRGGAVPWTRLAGEGGEVSSLAVRTLPGAPPTLLGGEYAPSRGGGLGWGEVTWGAFVWKTATAGRLLNLSYFDPGVDAAFDPGMNPVRWSFETRSIPTGGLTANVCSGARVRYTLSGPPKTLPLRTEHVMRFSRAVFPPATPPAVIASTVDKLLPEINAEFAADTKPSGVPTWGAVNWGEFTWASAESESYEALGNPAPPSLDAATAHRWRFARKRRFVRLRLTCDEPTSQLQLRSLELFVRRDARL